MTRATRAAHHTEHEGAEAHAIAPLPSRDRTLVDGGLSMLDSALGSIGAASRAETEADRQEHLAAATKAVLGARQTLNFVDPQAAG